MRTELHSPIQYELPIGEDLLPMNQFIGKYVRFKWLKEILCILCERKINKSFAQGFCYPCFINSPETSECILRPELCEAQIGNARDMDWAEKHCLQPHFVYLAVSSGIKVGVTRSTQIPTRWIDQGASFAIKFAETPNRYIAGVIEVAMKEFISDRTAWQRMLKNQILEDIDLYDKKSELIEKLNPQLQQFESIDEEIIELSYPVLEFPQKVKSIGFDKHNIIEGRIMGIKGQYLIFDDNTVLNIRKHNGYVLEIDS
ncbi:MAG: DUF2797 domain-containing protein [Candidatus Marinimicrobia bacterium]|nr:DUF2797 domain-containing protein [Candidatus Neomarinimicrobiota bacterium]